MPAERLSMRKVREVLRLKHACGASVRTIARSVGIGPHDGRRIPAADGGDRDHLAGAGGGRRRRAGAAAVHAGGLLQGADAGRCRTGTMSMPSCGAAA